MKCSEVHSGLDKADIRTFLAKQIGYGYDGEVDFIKESIAKLHKELIAAEASRAARELIKMNGWSEFDLSDFVSDYKKGVYFPFVGTDLEVERLTESIKE